MLRKGKLLLALVVFGWIHIPALLSAEEIKWMPDYRAARLDAASKSKLLVIHVTSTNCYWCRRLEAETLSHNKVTGLMNQQCVALKVDGKRDPSLIEALRIKSYPTIVLASPDGRILDLHEGYLDAPHFLAQLQRALTTVEGNNRLSADYQSALRAINDSDLNRARFLLNGIIADTKDRVLQDKARGALKEIETRTAEQLAKDAKDHPSQAQLARVTDNPANVLVRQSSTETDAQSRQARTLLASAQENYREGQYLTCLDQCERLIRDFADLNEASDALRMAATIKADPEFMKAVCDRQSDKLALLYLDQAEAWVKKGRTDQAIQSLKAVVRMFPESRNAQKAQERLVQLSESSKSPILSPK